jgi:hypothetical protein
MRPLCWDGGDASDVEKSATNNIPLMGISANTTHHGNYRSYSR